MLRLWGAGFPYSQYATIGGGQHNSAYLMRFQGLTYSGERHADSLIGERLFYCREEMIGEHTEEDVGFNPTLELMKYWSFRQGALHGTGFCTWNTPFSPWESQGPVLQNRLR